MAKNELRLFILEAPNPMDLLQKRSESEALEKICNLIGHEVAAFKVLSKYDFKKISKFIGSIDSEHDEKRREKVPICIHISAHGNEDELGIGSSDVKWPELFNLIQPLCKKLPYYDGKVILVISACKALSQKLTKTITAEFKSNEELVPPSYVFLTTGEPYWQDAAISWAIFYHQIPKIDLENKDEVIDLMTKIYEIGAERLMYFRWDSKNETYRKFDPKGKSKNKA